MGKWVYVNEDETPTSELKKIHSKLINASLKTTIDVDISFEARATQSNVVNVVFFLPKENKNFFTRFYSFRKLEKNQALLRLCIELIKDSSKFDEIESKIRGAGF